MTQQPKTPNLRAASRAATLSSAPRPASLHNPDDAAHLSVRGVSHAYGERRVLTDLSFTAAIGERLGRACRPTG